MIENECESFVGIDVSKAKLDTAVWGRDELWQHRNDPEGIAALGWK